jgi:hypothetical protein
MMSLKFTREDLELLMDQQDRIDDPDDTLWGTAITFGEVRVELGEPA